jgi:hypothetical protein
MIALTEAQCPWGARSARALCSAGAGRTHRCTEGNADRGMAVAIWALHSHDAPLPLREMAYLASRSITNRAAAKPFPARPCQLWSPASGPIRSIPRSV